MSRPPPYACIKRINLGICDATGARLADSEVWKLTPWEADSELRPATRLPDERDYILCLGEAVNISTSMRPRHATTPTLALHACHKLKR